MTEQPGGPDAIQGVVSGSAGVHVLELVVPLESRVPAPVHASRTVVAEPRPAGAGRYLPGSEWLSVALAAPMLGHDEILAKLASLAEDLAGHFDRWFWLRYYNPTHGPHLRIRFHGEPAVLGGTILPAISGWCSLLIANRLAGELTLEPYDPEIERYGGHAAMPVAERVFQADSRLVIAALAATSDPDQRLVIAGLSAVSIARSVADGNAAVLIGRNVEREAHRRLTDLRSLVRAAAETSSGANLMTHPTWAERQSALAAYRATLSAARRMDCASSLIHMHANRLLGDVDGERIARALAANVLAREAR